MRIQKGNSIYEFMAIEIEPEQDPESYKYTGRFELIGRLPVNSEYYLSGVPIVLKTYTTEQEANEALLRLSVSLDVTCFNG